MAKAHASIDINDPFTLAAWIRSSTTPDGSIVTEMRDEARGEGLGLLLLELGLRLRRPRLHGRHDLVLEGLLHPPAEGPPGEPERRPEHRAPDVVDHAVGRIEVEVRPSLALAGAPVPAKLPVRALDVVVVVVVVIGALPLCVMGLVWLSSPSYIALLWTDPFGRVMMACCAAWMMVGIFVMRKMINFDF